MALNKDILGQALMDATAPFNNKTADQLIATYGSIEAARLAGFKAQAEAFINHFKNNAVLSVPGAGLTAGGDAVMGTSTSGTIS